MKAMLSLRDFSESIPIVQQMSVYALFDVFVLHILVNIARIPTQMAKLKLIVQLFMQLLPILELLSLHFTFAIM